MDAMATIKRARALGWRESLIVLCTIIGVDHKWSILFYNITLVFPEYSFLKENVIGLCFEQGVYKLKEHATR